MILKGCVQWSPVFASSRAQTLDRLISRPVLNPLSHWAPQLVQYVCDHKFSVRTVSQPPLGDCSDWSTIVIILSELKKETDLTFSVIIKNNEFTISFLSIGTTQRLVNYAKLWTVIW